MRPLLVLCPIVILAGCQATAPAASGPAEPAPAVMPEAPAAPATPTSSTTLGVPPGAAGKVSPEAAAALVPAAVVSAPDRSDADKALDPGRKPVELLTFFGVKPGMRVAEIASGTGYTTELLARSVGPDGQVYGVNNAFVLEKFAEVPWSARLQKPVMANVVRVDREFDDPLPPEATDLDMVCNVLFYHDSVWMETDRAAMNAAIFRALRPGGTYVVIDHAAAPGRGVQDVKTLHRIEPSVVRAELEAAGFELVEESPFLANPEDPRDWNAAPSASGERRGTSDRFALKVQKPGP